MIDDKYREKSKLVIFCLFYLLHWCYSVIRNAAFRVRKKVKANNFRSLSQMAAKDVTEITTIESPHAEYSFREFEAIQLLKNLPTERWSLIEL